MAPQVGMRLDRRSKTKEHAFLKIFVGVGPSRTRMEGRVHVDKRSTRRFSSHHKHYDPSQDQVFPQLENGSNSDQDENNLPINIVAIAPPMAPAN